MNYRVLIVDDEPTIANTLEAILRSAGYDAKAVYSAEQALDLIAEWHPSAAIVDVILPGLNGIEFSKLLRARFADCGLLLFSGETHTGELLQQAEKEGYRFEILAKPVHPNELLERVAGLFARPPDRKIELLPEQLEGSTPDQAALKCRTTGAGP
jgi:DNA-binding response OmpR family regulator